MVPGLKVLHQSNYATPHSTPLLLHLPSNLAAAKQPEDVEEEEEDEEAEAEAKEKAAAEEEFMWRGREASLSWRFTGRGLGKERRSAFAPSA